MHLVSFSVAASNVPRPGVLFSKAAPSSTSPQLMTTLSP